MNMYLELSRPMGDVSRWEKVVKRISLLNKYYPMDPATKCKTITFQRDLKSAKIRGEEVYNIVLDNLLKLNVVFFGGFASSLFSKYMKTDKSIVRKTPDFDVLSNNADNDAYLLRESLVYHGFKNVGIKKHDEIHEVMRKYASRARASDAVWTMATARDRQAGDAVMIRAHERLKNWMNASA